MAMATPATAADLPALTAPLMHSYSKARFHPLI
jgi:hypothetical protein